MAAGFGEGAGAKVYECRVCDEVYSHQGDRVPRLLHCGHTVCHHCLTQIPLHANFLLCPFDRQPTLLGDSGVWGLKKNFALLELLERLQSPTEESPTEIATVNLQAERCDENSSHEASVYCITCATQLCTACSDTLHQSKTLARHRRVPLADKPRERPRCAVHPLHVVEFACLEPGCQSVPLMCYICRDYGRHKSHKHVLLEQEAEKARQTIDGALRHIQSFSGEIRDWMRRVNCCIQHVETHTPAFVPNEEQVSTNVQIGTADSARIKVREYFEELHATLVAQEQAALTVVDTYVRERLASLRHQQEEMEALLQQTNDMCSQYRNMLSEDDSRVLTTRVEVQSLLENMEKQKLQFIQLPERLSLDPDIPITFTKDNRLHIGPKLEMRVVTLGLDSAGKTSLLCRLKQNEFVNTVPTIGFNVETVEHQNLLFTIWDVGGQKKLRPLWKHYYFNTQALIFVVDCCNESRLPEAKAELAKLLQERELRDAALLLLANKQDEESSLGVESIVETLDLPKLCCGRSWHIQACSARSGSGVADSLDWLSRQLIASHGVLT